MRLALVFNPNDRKLSKKSYSQTYRDMFVALINRFEAVVAVTNSCKAKDIKADVIIVYDVHSSHHIEIDCLSSHPAVKYSYFNDPHQTDVEGRYPGGAKFRKLGVMTRSDRANRRGIQYIICPYKNGFDKYIKPHVSAELLWFPTAPRPRKIQRIPLKDRFKKVLCHGHIWQGVDGFRPYEFRRWAMTQPNVTSVPHSIVKKEIPSGGAYQTFLSQYVGAIAACDTYVVPKYLEIPMAGTLCLAQYHQEYGDMGFIDGENCLYIDGPNFQQTIQPVLSCPQDFQGIADAGYQNALRWSAEKFADTIHKHAEAHYGK